MGTTYYVILGFLGAALVALVVLWIYARRLKLQYEEGPPVVTGVRVRIDLNPEHAARLREISREPILLKQGDEGVRVQIEHRPMLPLMAFLGQDVSAAFTEAAGLVSREWGPRWVALISVDDDGVTIAQRLG